MSEPIIVVKLLYSNGKALPEFLDSLSLLFCLQSQRTSAPLMLKYLFFSLCLTTDHSNKPQVCQTCEGVALREALEPSEEEGKSNEERGSTLTPFFLSASFMGACLHQLSPEKVCGMGGCEFYITSVHQI